MSNLTPEIKQHFLALLADLKPYEIIEIRKDRDGRPNTFLVKREQKFVVTEVAVVSVK